MGALEAFFGVSVGLNLIGGFFAAENIKETAKLNLEINTMNAQFAELDAYDAELDGISQEAKYQTMVDATLANQQLAFAVSDVDIGFGTAADVVEETRFIAELNKLEIEKQAQERSAGFKSQARDFRTGGALEFSQAQGRASDARFGGLTGAARDITGYLRSR